MVVDSSVWIEILSAGELQKACEAEIGSQRILRIPTLVIYEVYRKMKQLVSEEEALEVVAFLRGNEVLEMDGDVALAAADISLQRKLPMADSLVLAHAILCGDTLLTLDNDFADQPEAKILRRAAK